VLAWLVAPRGRHECFWLVAVAVVCTYLYSVPPFRTKRLGIWANVTIAIPRGRAAEGRGLVLGQDDLSAWSPGTSAAFLV
jgi:4-hydroxybenzoate polyprenyltransferase